MRWLQGLSSEREMYSAEENGQDTPCRQGKTAECVQILHSAAGSYVEKDFHTGRDSAPGQPLHSVGGGICNDKRGHEFPAFSDPGEFQRHGGMVSCKHGL